MNCSLELPISAPNKFFPLIRMTNSLFIFCKIFRRRLGSCGCGHGFGGDWCGCGHGGVRNGGRDCGAIRTWSLGDGCWGWLLPGMDLGIYSESGSGVQGST